MADFVVDPSVACNWILPDETSDVSEAAYLHLQKSRAFAPDLLWHEARNVLMVACRRKRIDFSKAVAGMTMLRKLPIRVRLTIDDRLIFMLSERHGITAYDAAYLALAIETRLPLATLDRKLIAAAEKEGVTLLA